MVFYCVCERERQIERKKECYRLSTVRQDIKDKENLWLNLQTEHKLKIDKGSQKGR
jgi:hypothetical protein